MWRILKECSIGYGRFTLIAVIACSLIFMHALIEMVATAYVLDPAMCDLSLTVKQKGLIASGIFFGIMLTAICWGSISDHYGRRKVMLPALIAACIFSIASSLCSTFWPMFIFRIFTGFMVSASSATVLVYLGELVVEGHRDLAISIAVSSVAAIFCLVPVLAWGIVPRSFSFNFGFVEVKPWRVFMWSWAIIGFAGAAILFYLPESPNFILATKGPAEALPILIRIYAMNHKKDRSEFPVTQLRPASIIMPSGDTGIKTTLKDMIQLLRPPMLSCFLLTHFGMFMAFLLCNGIYLWTPSIFNMVLSDTSLKWTVCDVLQNSKIEAHSEIEWFHPQGDDNPYEGAAVKCGSDDINQMMYLMAVGMEVVLLIPFVIITYIVEVYRNKCVLYACVMIPCSIFLTLSALVPNIIASSGIFIILGICSGSCACILSAMAVDAFPTSLRALAMCTMYMMGHVGAVVGNSLTALSVTGPCVFLILFQAGLTAMSAILLLLFWPNLNEVRTEMTSRGFSY